MHLTLSLHLASLSLSSSALSSRCLPRLVYNESNTPSLSVHYSEAHLHIYDFSQNLGSWSPGTKILSTPSSVMMAMRIVPPEEPSRDMARARAVVDARESGSGDGGVRDVEGEVGEGRKERRRVSACS